jgi:hypothetical protein
MTAPRPPLPAIYDQILIFGGGSPPTSGRPIAEIGGVWRLPEYGLAYLLAARYVIEGGDADKRQNEVALSAVYLQRHALEIALKDLIALARYVKADERWLAALKLDLGARRPTVPEVPFKHDFTLLIGLLREALSDINYGDVPGEFISAAYRIQEVERNDETRTRYATGRDRESSFPDRIVIPVGQLQDDLEEAFAKHLHVDSTLQTDNLATNLAGEQLALDQAIRNLGVEL